MLLGVVSLMVVVGGASELAAPRGLRVGPFTARLMGVVDDVNTLGAQRALKGAQISVLPMVVAGDAVETVALELPGGNQDCASGMVVARDVKKKIAQKVQKASQVFASHMEVAAVAKLQDAQKGLKGAQCFARHMVEGRDALGVILGQNMVTYLLVLVPHLQGVRQVSVHFTAVWCRTRGFMVVSPLDLWSRTLKLVSLRRRKKLLLSRT